MTSFDRRTESASTRKPQYTGPSAAEPVPFSGADPSAAELAALVRGLVGERSLDDVLARIARALGEALCARAVGVWSRSSEEETVKLAASFGERSLFEPVGNEILRCLDDGRPIPLPGGWIVPVQAFEDPLGAVAVLECPSVSAEPPPLVELLALAAAFAIREVQWSRALRTLHREQRETQARFLQTERLASIGEASARLAADLALSLTQISGIARRLAEGAVDPEFGLLLHHARRAESHVHELQALSRLERPRLGMVDLAELTHQLVQECRAATERRRLLIEERYETALPKLLLDSRKVGQALSRILENAVEGTLEHQRVAVRVHRQGGQIAVEIASESEPPDGGVLDLLFVPFGANRSEIGLAVARQIVLDHGGEIEVGTGDEWPTVFRLRFPVRDNQDRRGRTDRRRGRDRRRAA